MLVGTLLNTKNYSNSGNRNVFLAHKNLDVEDCTRAVRGFSIYKRFYCKYKSRLTAKAIEFFTSTSNAHESNDWPTVLFEVF